MGLMYEDYKNQITKEMIDELKKEGQSLINEHESIWIATTKAMFEILCDDFVFIEQAQEENKTIQEHIKEVFSDIDFNSNDLYINDNNIVEYEKINLGVEV